MLSLYARGLTTGEISAHFAQIYGASVSKETVSRITDKVIEEMTSWASRPLDGWPPPSRMLARHLPRDRRLVQRPPTALEDRLSQPVTVRTTAGHPGRLSKQRTVRNLGSTPQATMS